MASGERAGTTTMDPSTSIKGIPVDAANVASSKPGTEIRVDEVKQVLRKSWKEALAGNRLGGQGMQLRYFPPTNPGIVEFTKDGVQPSITRWRHSLVGAVLGTNVTYSAMKAYIHR